MTLTDLLFETRASLFANPTRTLLTMLGIVIGIASVIAMLAIGQGTKASVEATVSSLGSNVLTITPGSGGGRPGTLTTGNTKSLTLADMKAIRAQIPEAALVTAAVGAKAQVVAGSENMSATISGVTPEYADIQSVDMDLGIFITERHMEGIAKVAVLGPTTRDNLFGKNADPIGKKVKIKSNSYTVIGVTKSKGGGGFSGNADEAVFVPLSTGMLYLSGTDHVNSITVSAATLDALPALEQKVRALLLSRHKITDPRLADFSIFNQAKIADSLAQITSAITMLLGMVAGISLIVGGIGIMNMMLTTVRERTREIGLRKAIGAKRSDISNQFLLESILITVIGGCIGVLFGVMIALVVNATGITQAVVTPFSIFLAFFVSGLVGIVFGYYPARKAAELNPIDALRYE